MTRQNHGSAQLLDVMIGARHLCILSRRSEAARYCIQLLRTQHVLWNRLVAILYLVGINLGHRSAAFPAHQFVGSGSSTRSARSPLGLETPDSFGVAPLTGPGTFGACKDDRHAQPFRKQCGTQNQCATR